MKNTAIPLLSVPFLLIAGCASSYSAVREAVGQAPEWYGERRTEIRGEGYPAIADVPRLEPASVPGRGLAQRRSRAAQLVAQFDNNPRAEPPQGGIEEILQLAADIRARLGDEEPPEAFLTEADLAAIRASFTVPRVTQD
ncbi:hypothetical protein [Hyphomonas sp.]|uniref:hypothetical protein n=1 Tax=Hyphomonas sp. TaxID=87 RepID=UPI00391964CD